MNGAMYSDGKYIYTVSPGISNGEKWMTVRMKYGKGGSHRVVSKNLPIRPNREEAQKDLDEYAKVKKLVAASVCKSIFAGLNRG